MTGAVTGDGAFAFGSLVSWWRAIAQNSHAPNSSAYSCIRATLRALQPDEPSLTSDSPWHTVLLVVLAIGAVLIWYFVSEWPEGELGPAVQDAIPWRAIHLNK